MIPITDSSIWPARSASTAPPGEQSFGSALDSRTWNDERIAAGLDQYPGIDEISRPQRVIIIGKPRLEADGGGGLVYDIVDQHELAGRERNSIVLVEGGHFDRTTLRGIAHLAEGGRREREQNRRRLVEHQGCQ